MKLKPDTIFNLTRSVSIGLYIISLTQPCFDTLFKPGESWEGLAVLISGSIGFFSCAAGYTWLANPALFASWYNYKHRFTRSLILSTVASVIALCFLLVKNMMVNEGGNSSQITGYRLGYWLWVASALSMMAGNLWIWLLLRRQSSDEHAVINAL